MIDTNCFQYLDDVIPTLWLLVWVFWKQQAFLILNCWPCLFSHHPHYHKHIFAHHHLAPSIINVKTTDNIQFHFKNLLIPPIWSWSSPSSSPSEDRFKCDCGHAHLDSSHQFTFSMVWLICIYSIFHRPMQINFNFDMTNEWKLFILICSSNNIQAN